MIVRRFFTVLLLALVAILAGFTAGQLPVVLNGTAERALVPLAKTEEEVLRSLKNLSTAETSTLLDREKMAFAAEPLERKALQNAVALHELRGERDSAEAVALVLADYGRRSIGAQLSVIQLQLSKGNFGDAFDRIDGILRAKPEFSEQLYPAVLATLQDPKSLDELARVLAREPSWRPGFFLAALKADEQGGVAYRVAVAMRNAKVSITDWERRALLGQLFKLRKYDGAYFVWLDLLAQEDLVRMKQVFDGRFDVQPRNLLFDWNVPKRKNARSGLVRKSGAALDQVLSFDFLSDKDPTALAYQYLRLVPGDYAFGGEFQTNALKSPGKLVWRIVCIEKPATLGESPPLEGAGPWQKLTFRFSVPQENCDTQMLRLENRSSAALDRDISGNLAVDNIEITMVSGNAETPEAGQQ